MLPLLLLKTAQGHPVVSSSRVRFAVTSLIKVFHYRSGHFKLSHSTLQLVELKNGETYNGHMVQCDSWMNVHLREVICTSKVSCPWCQGHSDFSQL